MGFGEALQQARKELGWTQPQLADAMQAASDGQIRLTPAELSRYERGRVKNPRLEVIRAAAKATGRPIDKFTSAVATEEAALSGDTFRGAGGDQSRRRAKGAAASAPADGTDVTEVVA